MHASAAKPPLRCRTVATDRFRQLSYIRDLPPQPTGVQRGLDTPAAPSPSEAVLAAFGACLATGIHAGAAALSIAVRSLELELEADAGADAAWAPSAGRPEPLGFAAVRVVVRLDAAASRGTLSALVNAALLRSPVANTLHNPVRLELTLAAS